MKTYALLLAIAVMGYGTGILMESIAFGQESKIQNLIQTGSMTERWIPFGLGSAFSTFSIPENFVVIAELNADSMSFLKEGHLDIGDAVLTNGYVDFKIEVENVDGKFLANKVTECIFQPEETVEEITCLVCELLEADGVTIAADGNIDLTGLGLVAFQSETILVDPTSPWSDNVQNIHAVRIKVCIPEEEGGQGCTPGFWKQSQHFGHWETYSPGDDYETIFGVQIVIKEPNNAMNNMPTLLEALNAQGGAQNALARHSVAALLNAASSGTSFLFTEAGVIALVQAAFVDGSFEQKKNLLAAENELGCPLSGQDPGDPNINSFSETGGVDSTTYSGATITPYEKKQYSLDQLNTLVTDPTITQNTIDYLNAAIVNLQAIVNNENYWVDDYHVDIVTGQFVLDNSQEATTALIVITNSGESQSFKDSIQLVIDELVAADSLLAQTAVDDIGACGGKNSKIDNHLSNAQTKLTQAQQDSNDKKYDLAIQKFYDAWFEAFQATESCPTGYWTQLDGYSVVE